MIRIKIEQTENTGNQQNKGGTTENAKKNQPSKFIPDSLLKSIIIAAVGAFPSSKSYAIDPNIFKNKKITIHSYEKSLNRNFNQDEFSKNKFGFNLKKELNETGFNIQNDFPFHIPILQYEASNSLDEMLLNELISNKEINVIVNSNIKKEKSTIQNIPTPFNNADRIYSVFYNVSNQKVIIPEIHQEFCIGNISVQNFLIQSNQLNLNQENKINNKFYDSVLDIMNTLFAGLILMLIRIKIEKKYLGLPIPKNIYKKKKEDKEEESLFSHATETLNLKIESNKTRIYSLIVEISEELKSLLKVMKVFKNKGIVDSQHLNTPQPNLEIVNKLEIQRELSKKKLRKFKEDISWCLFRLKNLVYSPHINVTNQKTVIREYNEICVALENILLRVIK